MSGLAREFINALGTTRRESLLSFQRLRSKPSWEGVPMRQAPLGYVSKSLHAQFDHITEEPLPKGWVELIHRLNEIEHRQTQMLVKAIQVDEEMITPSINEDGRPVR